MKDIVTIYGHLDYFTAISYILWTFWYMYFFSFGVLNHEKSGNPGLYRVYEGNVVVSWVVDASRPSSQFYDFWIYNYNAILQ
jgi:hypothetical protein